MLWHYACSKHPSNFMNSLTSQATAEESNEVTKVMCIKLIAYSIILGPGSL